MRWRKYLANWQKHAVLLCAFILVVAYIVDNVGEVRGEPPPASSANITVSGTPYYVVTPTITNGANATNVLATSARLNGELTDDGGGSCNVSIFWGLTDGTDNATAWGNEENLGNKPEGTFYKDLTGLSANTTYFYRSRAVNEAGTGWANTTANFTTMESYLGPPTNFNANYIDDQKVILTWAKGESAENTIIVMNYECIPEDRYDGMVVYTGDGEEQTDYYINLVLRVPARAYYAAWSANETLGYSANYASTSVEGEGMQPLVAQLTIIGQLLASLLPLVIISVFAFWKENAILFMMAAGTAIMTGLYAPDIISGNTETTPLGITVGLMLMAYSILCCGYTYRLMFWRGR